jgi:DNA-binding Lrp family transcriptional regulator
MDFYIYENQREKFKAFKSVDHLNDSIRSYMYKYKKELHNANTNYQDLNVIGKVFKVIYTHSVKVAGVSFLSNKTIAKMLGISARSVRRATQKLLELGIILKLSTKRKNGSDTTNTIVIKPLLSSLVDKLFRVKKTPCPPPLSSLESRSFKQEKSLKEIDDIDSYLRSFIESENKELVNDVFNYTLKQFNQRKNDIIEPEKYIVTAYLRNLEKHNAGKQFKIGLRNKKQFSFKNPKTDKLPKWMTKEQKTQPDKLDPGAIKRLEDLLANL